MDEDDDDDEGDEAPETVLFAIGINEDDDFVGAIFLGKKTKIFNNWEWKRK